MKNLDYTLTVRDVTPSDQQYVGWLFNALHELFAKLGNVGSVLKTEPSPEPVVPAEVWIVEVEQATSGWQQSKNEYTRVKFTTQAEAEAAIQKNWSEGHGVHLRYRAVRTEPTRFEARARMRTEPAEQWIVEFFCFNYWKRSNNSGSKSIFNTRAEAQKAANAETASCRYRVRQII